mmetsp:Transcript_27515/g.37987  ORF Transcript_27515/g.37987 Transcript_27515/m.37987 type:complete len:207 (+) Transcript_27515:151-771(+)|eukprot:CAMPEP_0196570722 /NCGR_PEP_ID=MMETSP1081-20130531/885_1 /TAXON_ID=36882 /ORGANISM="Pyramimonas amylifera, Strain CCMP720" /LENGTH=206 /DNA_ID=CAMNT_0041887329 /DNA_START=133 /DNA_END=753 /DNA_ORIENTATION=+
MEVVGADRYNPQLLPQLEKNVDHQVQKGTYNLDTNLCLLRLYQLYPERVDMNVLFRLLLKSLMALPSMDYELCLHLVAEKHSSEEPLKSLKLLSGALSSAKFQQFWNIYNTMKDKLESTPGFKEKCRAYIVHVLYSVYQRVPKAYLGEALAIEGMALDAFVEAQCVSTGWTVDGDMLVFPANEDNHPQPKKAADNITFSQVSQCLI